MAADIEQRVGAYVDAHADEMVGFLQKVVQSKSLWGEVAALERCGALLAARMAEAGVRVERPDSGTPGAPNVLGRIGDASSGRRLLFCGHYDVYPPSKAWSFDPWSAPIRDGKVYGPGSTDMKGGTTGMVVAATVLAALGEPKGGEVVVLGVPNHFEGGEGTRRAFDQGLTAEAGIVCEPTDLDICAAQRGILYMDITITGIGAHTTYETVGVNAIEPVIPIIQALKAPAFAKPDHNEFGAEKIVNIALVKGGLRRCLIPEECVLTVDVRFAPSTTAAAVLDEVRGILAGIERGQKFSIHVEPQESCVRNPRSPMNWVSGPIRDRLAAEHAAFRGAPPAVSCHPAWPDTPVLIERGVPSVTYGPGSKYCYWDEEFVPIDEYLTAIKVYAATAARWFGG
ncbi:MAG TPA: M20/M25/M40 family metallo-hydrolase [Bauldia sp.]|nr:M20/M25/M40 family metallo-hydrolase [Bauldia sp.]